MRARSKRRLDLHREALKQGKPGVTWHVQRFLKQWTNMRTAVFTREGNGKGGEVYRLVNSIGDPIQVELGRKRTTSKTRVSGNRPPWKHAQEVYK